MNDLIYLWTFYQEHPPKKIFPKTFHQGTIYHMPFGQGLFTKGFVDKGNNLEAKSHCNNLGATPNSALMPQPSGVAHWQKQMESKEI